MGKENPDPNYPFVNIKDSGGNSTIQNRLILTLVQMLDEAGYKDLNYDHTDCSVPKSDVPLKNENGRCDIAVGIHDDIFAQIEVEIRRCVQS